MNILSAKHELDKITGYILADELKPEDKKQITEDSIDNYNTYINPGWLKYRKSVSTNAAFIEWRDEGDCFYDVNDEEFIDCLGGFGIYMCGHRNPYILEVVKAQLDRQALHSQELVDPLRGYLAKVMADITPGDLEKCFFTNGGAEAIEMALKLARIASGGGWYISTVNGFHGKSYGAVSVGGKSTYRAPYLPMIQQVQHVQYGNAADLRTVIMNLQAVGEKVAAVVMEPIQGEAGIILPPKGYLKEVRSICDELGVFLIFDEIQTGMGRTGRMFRCEAEDVVPDILVYGKAFGGGIMPITGIIARPHLWVEELVENPWLLGSPTFGGNPLACSAALATIKYMLDNDVPQMAADKGEYLIKGLYELHKKYPKLIQEVRGMGMMIGVEFFESDFGYSVAKEMFARRIMTAGTLINAKTIRFEPAATITMERLDRVLKALDESLAATEKNLVPLPSVPILLA
jgi:putrescine aminotransferase